MSGKTGPSILQLARLNFVLILLLFVTSTSASTSASTSGDVRRLPAELAPSLFVNTGSASSATSSHPCAKAEIATIRVSVLDQILTLCAGPKPLERFKVALGSRGFPKMREFDRKTPIGRYSVRVHVSPGYGRSLYVGYPTREQAAAGYTGSQILVHGPPKDWKRELEGLFAALVSEFGSADGSRLIDSAVQRLQDPAFGSTSVNWTAGCIAVGTVEEIDRIVNFVALHHDVVISID